MLSTIWNKFRPEKRKRNRFSNSKKIPRTLPRSHIAVALGPRLGVSPQMVHSLSVSAGINKDSLHASTQWNNTEKTLHLHLNRNSDFNSIPQRTDSVVAQQSRPKMIPNAAETSGPEANGFLIRDAVDMSSCILDSTAQNMTSDIMTRTSDLGDTSSGSGSMQSSLSSSSSGSLSLCSTPYMTTPSNSSK